ncbi:peptide-methionine (S)-S-oxide reductase MsrA [Parenemella sanctibonifatiensis]|uniref:Peptide methionine sulfoxide reductase MsrA n=1 Tax=Parenemella sanctibonifatiensis TaxID=2016505 RepID=A0A255EM62_9ACTN|nr:peptide-methionine (S)-S-oxide reductase MsrA [Parenemella sanctibonifatiensis]OYN92300.1 peptide-methionine (S)-S-oxide reductase [Parenemella sanctibonifatiensis]
MFGSLFGDKQTMVTPERALRGRETPVLTSFPEHLVLEVPIDAEPPGSEVAYLAGGCFWGIERIAWRLDGVVNTAVGYMGGYTPNPTYEETCTAKTGHAETVKVVFDPKHISYAELLQVFFENHNPTTANRQGNDIGTQYRSAIFTTSEEQAQIANDAIIQLDPRFRDAGHGPITTQVSPAGTFYYAEAEHQQYLDRNPNGYCNHGPNGMSCPIGVLD